MPHFVRRWNEGLNDFALGRHVDQCLMSAGVVQTERDQVMYPKLAHVAERIGGRGVTGGWGSLTSWDGLQILSRPDRHPVEGQRRDFRPSIMRCMCLRPLWGNITATGGLAYRGVSRCLQAERHTFVPDFTL